MHTPTQSAETSPLVVNKIPVVIQDVAGVNHRPKVVLAHRLFVLGLVVFSVIRIVQKRSIHVGAPLSGDWMAEYLADETQLATRTHQVLLGGLKGSFFLDYLLFVHVWHRYPL